MGQWGDLCLGALTFLPDYLCFEGDQRCRCHLVLLLPLGQPGSPAASAPPFCPGHSPGTGAGLSWPSEQPQQESEPHHCF